MSTNQELEQLEQDINSVNVHIRMVDTMMASVFDEVHKITARQFAAEALFSPLGLRDALTRKYIDLSKAERQHRSDESSDAR